MSRDILLVILALSIAALVTIGLTVDSFSQEIEVPREAEARMTIKEVINRVESNRPRSPQPELVSFSPTHVGQQLRTGDGIKTFRNSEARVDVTIKDFTRITRTTPNTIWRLGKFTFDAGTVIELDQGKIFLFDDGYREGQPEFQVVTPAGTAAPRGTWMSV